jgi:hypothetical protein
MTVRMKRTVLTGHTALPVDWLLSVFTRSVSRTLAVHRLRAVRALMRDTATLTVDRLRSIGALMRLRVTFAIDRMRAIRTQMPTLPRTVIVIVTATRITATRITAARITTARIAATTITSTGRIDIDRDRTAGALRVAISTR